MILTVTFSTLTDGRAVAYSRNITLIPIPITIPISNRKNKQDKKVAQAGIKSVSINKTKYIYNYINKLMDYYYCVVAYFSFATLA